METRTQIVEANNGEKTEALVAVCEQCKGETFSILVIHGHNHLLCDTCKTTFCQGGGQCGDIFCETK